MVLKNTGMRFNHGLVRTRGDVKLRNTPAYKLAVRVIWPRVALVRNDNFARALRNFDSTVKDFDSCRLGKVGEGLALSY